MNDGCERDPGLVLDSGFLFGVCACRLQCGFHRDLDAHLRQIIDQRTANDTGDVPVFGLRFQILDHGRMCRIVRVKVGGELNPNLSLLWHSSFGLLNAKWFDGVD